MKTIIQRSAEHLEKMNNPDNVTPLRPGDAEKLAASRQKMINLGILVISTLISALVASATAGTWIGREQEKLDRIVADSASTKLELATKVDQLSGNTQTLAVTIAALNAQLGDMKNLITQERQDRLNDESRYIRK